MSFQDGNHEWKKRKSHGRKPKAVVERYNAILLEECKPEDWRTVCRTAVAGAKAGRARDREFVAERILGKVPEKHELTGADGEPILVRVDV